MYTLVSGLWKCVWHRPEHRVLIIGLDNAGKSTLLERCKVIYDRPEVALPPEKIMPTVGLNIGRFNVDGMKLLCWDLGGQRQLQVIWQKYYAECHAVIFVVDASDSTRFQQVTDTINTLAADATLSGVPILVFANKQDRSSAIRSNDLTDALDLSNILSRRTWKCVDVCALSGDGVRVGMKWLVDSIRSG